MGKSGHKQNDRFAFLSPASVIRRAHLTDADTLEIKHRLSEKMGTIGILVGALATLAISALLLYQGIHSGWRNVEVYGLFSQISQFLCIGGCLSTIVLLLIAKRSGNQRKERTLIRFALNVLYLSFLINLAGCLYSDAEKGFLTKEEALSPSILLVIVLLLLQPAFWVDMAILDMLTSAVLIAVAIIVRVQFNAGALFYYIIVAVLFPPSAHIVASTLFYAETQSYIQMLANERLNNKVLYDELTHCKSRVALKNFLEENEEKWVAKESDILLIMFDIDDFKKYNDQFSHVGGDRCLRSVSDAIRAAFPSPNLDFFRYGGEEFLLFFELKEDDDPQQIMEKARIAVRDVKLTAPDGAPKDVVTISLGGTVFHSVGNFSFKKELETVDNYLYQAKSSGKDVSVLDGELVKE